MAKSKNASKGHRLRAVDRSDTRAARGGSKKRERKRPAPSMPYGTPTPAGLHEAIEAERGNLAKAESLLGCLMNSMEYDMDSATAPYYPDVAQLARDLVRQSINGLDSLTLERHLSRNKVKEDTEPVFVESCWEDLGGALSVTMIRPQSVSAAH